MKEFFQHWLAFTLLIALVWFGGRGMGWIRLERTLEESIRAAALADVIPTEIDALAIINMKETPPTVEMIELRAPTAMVGRLKVRDLELIVHDMEFRLEGPGPLARHLPVSAGAGSLTMRMNWSDLEESLQVVVDQLLPGPFRPETVSLSRVAGQFQLVTVRKGKERMIPAEFFIEDSGKIRLKIFPTDWLLKNLPKKFRDQVLGRMPGTRGLPWVWEQVIDDEGITLRGHLSPG
ncbi:hypothetical protein H8D30_00065 [bacterium]|nr:hypothetical protein [bacterium]